MQIVDKKALSLKLRDPDRVTDVIPKSGVTSEGRVLVRWGMEEVRVLRNLGINAPSPIKGKYDWPGRYAPYDHQITTASFFTLERKGFCFNEQGTGKTASAIWASDYLLNEGIINRVLIVCPLSIMDSAWREDLFSFAMHRRVDVAYGSKDKRTKIINSDAEYVIINYDGLVSMVDVVREGGFDMFIIDEATHYKNPATRRWKVLNSLVGKDSWLWMMTGTPAAQSPVDAYGLAKLVNPEGVPRFLSSFKDKVMRKVTNFKWVPKEDASATVHKVLQPAIRFTKEECLDLPSMVYVRRTVPLTKQQEKYYKELKNRMVTEAAGEVITAANAAVNMNKLLQISAGAVYTDDKEAVEFDISPRYKVLREVIDESSKKVLVFVPFKHTIELLVNKLRDDGVTADVIMGSVSAAKRTHIFKQFQENSDPQVLVIQPQAAAHGVTLTAANTVVWWSPVSSLETYAQANARVHRAGQDTKCTVIQLGGSYVESRMYGLLDDRINVHTQMIDLYNDLLK